MLRKSVWITALLLALTFVFFGCDDSKYLKKQTFPEALSGLSSYKKVSLAIEDDKSLPYKNAGDNVGKQQGWEEGTGAKNFKLADFASAEYLVLEFTTKPQGNISLVWQPEDGWKSNNILTNQGGENQATGTKFYGDSLLIVLGLSLIEYDAAVTDIKKLLIAYYSPDIVGLGIKSASLYIPQ
jgi:hypothetical protein